ncbi:MFS transporter [Alcaligenes sp. WGS1538]|uniref:MFS transporter n=1 Tax=Alcaligenes sp. WGS1538 TaxID=3366811 RepID=UPI00372D2D38
MRNAIFQRIQDGLRRRPALEITLACLAVLLLAQTLIGALSLAALDRLNRDMVADRVEVEVRRMAVDIESGLRLGKPLAQFFGLGRLLGQGLAELRDGRGAAVWLTDGQSVAAQGEDIPESPALLRAVTDPQAPLAPGVVRRPNHAAAFFTAHRITVAVALRDAAASTQGVALLSVARDTAASQPLVLRNLGMLGTVTLLVGLGLAAVYKYLVPAERLGREGRLNFLLPLGALMLAQGVYAGDTIATFRSVSLQVTRDNAAIVAQGLQRDLERVLAYGMAIDRLRGVDAPLARLAGTFPIIRSIELLDASGKVLERVDAQPSASLPADAGAAEASLSLPLMTEGGRRLAGSLRLELDDALVAAGVRARMLDAATVVVVALVAAIEMLLLLSFLLQRPRGAESSGKAVGQVGRPVMFGFLFSWALPLGFLPVYARSLPADGLTLPTHLLMALPISVEMCGGLLTALLAGSLTDRKGWSVPVLGGLGVCGLGFLASAMAPNLLWFAAARGLVGLGYGLTWMGLQGFVVMRSPANYRGRNMSNVLAGLFAGHLAGAAVGAMLMEQLGGQAVFLVGVAFLLLPLLGVTVLMRSYRMSTGERATPNSGSAPVKVDEGQTLSRLRQTIRLICTPGFGLLLLGSVVPFSIAQVGLLSYALPLYMDAQGASASSVGRVLMVYGLCVIYLGPLMGELADRTSIKKRWIVAGGLVGSLGLLGLHDGDGLTMAVLAVLSLAVASCLIGASQSPYMLALPDVQRYGAAGATSIVKAADKLGQMAGPLVVASLYGAVGMGAGLALTGMIYLLATLLFMMFTPRPPKP